jgi:hypothetical protein
MPDLERILARSRADEALKSEVRSLSRIYVAHGLDRVVTTRPTPAVKAQRVLTQLFAEHPELAAERVTVDATSGCSDFTGSLTVHATDGVRVYDFLWCCRWRAEQEGWVDAFGFPDQVRAAREFGWRCFSEWRERPFHSAASRN